MTFLLIFLLWIVCAVTVIALFWGRREWRRWRIAQALRAAIEWNPGHGHSTSAFGAWNPGREIQFPLEQESRSNRRGSGRA